MITHHLPGNFILFDIKHGIFDCFVHECVNTGDEKGDCSKQCLSIFGQKLLGVSIVTKLLLKEKILHILIILSNFAYSAQVPTVSKATAGASIIQYKYIYRNNSNY